MRGGSAGVGLRGLLAAAVTIGAIFATVLVVPAVWHFVALNARFGVGAALLALAALSICGWNVWHMLREARTASVRSWQRWAVLGAFPPAMLGAVYDCAGFRGCTPICGFINTRIVPLLIVGTLAYLLVPRMGVLFALTAACFALLVPSCNCYNPANRAWIDWIGLSPTCFAAPFLLAMMAIAALVTGRLVLITAAIGWLTAIGQLGFHIGHHYFHWPW